MLGNASWGDNYPKKGIPLSFTYVSWPLQKPTIKFINRTVKYSANPKIMMYYYIRKFHQTFPENPLSLHKVRLRALSALSSF